jgi:hypothetical protein
MKDLFDLLELFGHLLRPHPGRTFPQSLARNALMMLGIVALAALVLLGCILATG